MHDLEIIQALRGRINHPDLQSGLDHWCLMRGERPFPSRADLDPLDIPLLLPAVSLVDVLTDPVDFRFRLVGAQPAGSHSTSIGESAFDIPEEEGREHILTRYRDCVAKRRPIHDIYDCTTLNRELHRVEVITCPMSTDGTLINMLLNFGIKEHLC